MRSSLQLLLHVRPLLLCQTQQPIITMRHRAFLIVVQFV